MKTYTQFIDTDRGEVELPHQAMAMFELVTERTGELSVGTIAERSFLEASQASAALSTLTRKGYLTRVKRGTYQVTRDGRAVWTAIFDKELNSRRRKTK